MSIVTKEPFAPFPLTYYERVLRYLLGRGDVEFITYDDFDWADDFDYAQGYPGEFDRWRKSILSNRRNPTKAYLLIQHDADSGPIATVEMAKLERSLGIRSSLMVFDRWGGSGVFEDIVDYPIDWKEISSLREAGFTIGYHCNAFQNVHYDAGKVYLEFDRDVRSLKEKVGNLNFFSPHGGKGSLTGQFNASFEYPENTSSGLRWVHNRYSPRFNGAFSDGGLLGRLKKSAPLIDFGAWAHGLVPGRRYRALIHPQYYSNMTFKLVEEVKDVWYLAACEGI